MGEKVRRIQMSSGGRDAESIARSDMQARSIHLDRSGVREHLTEDDIRDIVKRAQPLDTKFIRDVHSWMLDHQGRPVLVLSGTVGRGKTYAAAWALAHADGSYVPANEFVRIFSARFGDDRVEQSRLMQQSLLVIDDIGREGRANQEAMLSALVEVVDARRSSKRRTILITNEDRRRFVERYGDERLVSRLAQSGVFRSDSGGDYRRDGELPGPLPLETYEECYGVFEPIDPEEFARIARQFHEKVARIGGAS